MIMRQTPSPAPGGLFALCEGGTGGGFEPTEVGSGRRSSCERVARCAESENGEINEKLFKCEEAD